MGKPDSYAKLRLAGVSDIPVDGYPPAPAPVAESRAAAALRGVRDAGLEAVSNQGVAQGLRDVAGRTAAAVLGAPVDMTTLVLRPAGYTHPAPVGGSEWIGQQLEGMGAVSPVRRPAAELLASLPAPSGASKVAGAFAAAMSPEGKARLMADLVAGKGSGRYRLGDVSESQGRGLDEFFGTPVAARDVFMTDTSTAHLLAGRVQKDGFTPEEVTRFAEQAMAGRARPDLNVAKGGQNPSLLNTGLRDQATNRPYDARMPLRQAEDGLEVRSVVPEGLRARNEKTPKR